jgi:hypothetical protein
MMLPAPAAPSQARKWDALAAIIASLIGVLALLVSGYTAYVQRQQVRAQVWPYLLVGNYDPESALKVLNKGVGPAIVRSVRIWVDDKPQHDWNHVFAALGLPVSSRRTSTIDGNVLSPGESVTMIALTDAQAYQQFRNAVRTRSSLEICYCSTLDECWVSSDRHVERATQTSVEQCPRLADDEKFVD